MAAGFLWRTVLLFVMVCSSAIFTRAQSGSWDTNNLTWTYGGPTSWFVQTNITHDGGDALQSGVVTSGQITYVETQVAGPAKLQYWWKVSASSSGSLHFSVNVNSAGSTISGETDWQQKTFYIGAGTQILRWSYALQFGTPAGANAGWLDQVSIQQPAAPEITAQPASASLLPGGYFILSATVFGATPAAYQWRFNDTNDLPGETNLTLTITNVVAAHQGRYSLFVTNAYGATLSSNATITLQSISQTSAMEKLWSKAVGTTSWLQADTNNSYPWRGIAYNPFTQHVLVSSRAAGTNIWVLDAETGDELYTLDLTGVISERFPINCVRVAEDGAIYACNLRVSSDTTNIFRVYRWANDSSNTVPQLAWAGEPVVIGTGVRLSLGDSFDVQGSGIATRFILASYCGNPVSGFYVMIITPGNGVNSAAQAFSRSSFSFGPTYVCFAAGDAFWVKAPNTSLQYFSFAGTNLTVTATCTNVDNTICGMDADPLSDRIAANVAASPDALELFDLKKATNGARAIDFEFFQLPVDSPNGPIVGAVDIYQGRVYALDANNGILAMKYAPDVQTIQNVDGSTMLTWAFGVLQSSSDLNGSFDDVPGATSPYTIAPTANQSFYRVRN